MHSDAIKQQEDFRWDTNIQEEPPYCIYADD